jgi:hypothetical protein
VGISGIGGSWVVGVVDVGLEAYDFVRDGFVGVGLDRRFARRELVRVWGAVHMPGVDGRRIVVVIAERGLVGVIAGRFGLGGGVRVLGSG